MSQEDNEKERTKLEKYLIRQGRQNLIEELRNLGTDKLKEKLLAQALYKQETIDAKNNDEKLKAAKDTAKEQAAPYNESIRMNDKISRYINALMKDL